jgi:hypothetical protein
LLKGDRIMGESIHLFKRRTRSFDAKQFEGLARHLGIKGKSQNSDEALLHNGDARTLAYAQPCSRFAGLLFFVDQSVAWGEASGKVLSAKRAQAWSEELLDKFELRPRRPEDDRIRFEFGLEARETEAVVFDGKERRRVKAKTDVVSQATLNGIPVVGPRAKARLVFKEDALPVMAHIGLWDSLTVHEERERVREHDVARVIGERLSERNRCEGKAYRLCDLRLVYMADEFHGGPDLLSPEYLVEIELQDPRHGGENAPIPPRQVLRIPAWR